MTKKSFDEVMRSLEAAFGKKLRSETYEQYWLQLKDYEDWLVEKAARQIIRSEEYFPAIAKLLFILRENEPPPGAIKYTHDPERPYGSHRWPFYHRKNLKRFRNYAELARCCDACQAEANKLVGQTQPAGAEGK